ncbi:MAG: Trp biosynthesis-associated membrane protein [Nostocoides sp.]
MTGSAATPERPSAGVPTTAAPGMPRLRRASTAVLLTVAGAGLVVLTGSRLWATSSVTDTGLGTTAAAVTGVQAVGPLIALVLAAAAGGLAAVTAGRVGRLIGTIVLCGATLIDAILVVRFLADPATVVGQVAAEAMGRTGSLPVSPTATIWPWLALAGLALLLLAGVVAALGIRSWRGLSGRYDAAADAESAGPRGERVASDWERLSAGEDPTADGGPDRPGRPAT